MDKEMRICNFSKNMLVLHSQSSSAHCGWGCPRIYPLVSSWLRVSGLEGALVAAVPRLTTPLLQSSTHSMAATAGRVMSRAITMCADVSALLEQPRGSAALRTYRPAAASRSWMEAKAELAASMTEAVQLYWSAVAEAHHQHHPRTGAPPLQDVRHQQGLRVASSREVSRPACAGVGGQGSQSTVLGNIGCNRSPWFLQSSIS